MTPPVPTWEDRYRHLAAFVDTLAFGDPERVPQDIIDQARAVMDEEQQ